MKLKLYVIVEYYSDPKYYKYMVKNFSYNGNEIVKPYKILETFSDINQAREYLQFLNNEPDQHNGAPWSYALEEL